MKTTTCTTCLQPFDYEPILIDGREVLPRRHCSSCSAAQEARWKAEREASRLAELKSVWQKICPPEFDAIERERLPVPSLLDCVLDWRHGPRGLLLHGATGCGKTRCAWQLLKREHFAGRSVLAATAFDLAGQAARMLAGASQAEEWIQRRVEVDLLLLDDVFKAKFSERAEEALFVLIDERTSHRLPIIVTGNDTGESLMARLSPDRGGPLVRRLRDYCEAIRA